MYQSNSSAVNGEWRGTPPLITHNFDAWEVILAKFYMAAQVLLSGYNMVLEEVGQRKQVEHDPQWNEVNHQYLCSTNDDVGIIPVNLSFIVIIDFLE